MLWTPPETADLRLVQVPGPRWQATADATGRYRGMALALCRGMSTIENGFAGLIGRTVGGFTDKILGQAAHIDRLQRGQGAGAAPPLKAGASLEQVVARVRQDPAFADQVMQALERHPPLMRKAQATMAARPDLAAKLPAPVRGRLGLP